MKILVQISNDDKKLFEFYFCDGKAVVEGCGYTDAQVDSILSAAPDAISAVMGLTLQKLRIKNEPRI